MKKMISMLIFAVLTATTLMFSGCCCKMHQPQGDRSPCCVQKPCSDKPCCKKTGTDCTKNVDCPMTEQKK